MPVSMRGNPEVSISRSGRALLMPGAASTLSRSRLPAPDPVPPIEASTSVFQAPQSGQRPSQRGCCAPQSVQPKTDLTLATAAL